MPQKETELKQTCVVVVLPIARRQTTFALTYKWTHQNPFNPGAQLEQMLLVYMYKEGRKENYSSLAAN